MIVEVRRVIGTGDCVEKEHREPSGDLEMHRIWLPMVSA